MGDPFSDTYPLLRAVVDAYRAGALRVGQRFSLRVVDAQGQLRASFRAV